MTNPTISTRQRILWEGLALMSRSGLRGITVGVLGVQIGISKNGPFAQLRSKEYGPIEFFDHDRIRCGTYDAGRDEVP